jgi:hypothetical protein
MFNEDEGSSCYNYYYYCYYYLLLLLFIICITSINIMALQASVGPWPLFQFLDHIHIR